MPKLKVRNPVICSVLKEHFGKSALHEFVTATREFPATARLDLQTALSEVLSGQLQPKKVVGAHASHEFETITFAHLLVESDNAVLVAPLQYDEIDAGAPLPARCLRNALWFCAENGTSFTVFLSRVQRYGRPAGLHLEIAVPPGESGSELSRRIFDQVERKVTQAGSQG